MKLIINKFLRNFSIHNYDKGLVAKGIKRQHGRFIYDEHFNIKYNENLQNSLLKKELEIFEKTKPKFEEFYKKYYDICMKRKDPRNIELPEIFDDYSYFSVQKSKKNRIYQVIYRKDKLNKETLVLDLLDIPYLKEYQKTVILAKIALSDCHSKLAYVIDRFNNENYLIGFRDINSGTHCRYYLTNACNVQFSKDQNKINIFFILIIIFFIF